VIALSKRAMSASAGTAVLKGHQNSTAANPALCTSAGRSSRGNSVRSVEQFTVYIVGHPFASLHRGIDSE
jgi:hypothetical protein